MTLKSTYASCTSSRPSTTTRGRSGRLFTRTSPAPPTPTTSAGSSVTSKTRCCSSLSETTESSELKLGNENQEENSQTGGWRFFSLSGLIYLCEWRLWWTCHFSFLFTIRLMKKLEEKNGTTLLSHNRTVWRLIRERGTSYHPHFSQTEAFSPFTFFFFFGKMKKCLGHAVTELIHNWSRSRDAMKCCVAINRVMTFTSGDGATHGNTTIVTQIEMLYSKPAATFRCHTCSHTPKHKLYHECQYTSSILLHYLLLDILN